MRLLRFGPKGAEKPGLLDAAGRIRDLSAHVGDITPDVLAPDSLDGLAGLDPSSLPQVQAIRASVRRSRACRTSSASALTTPTTPPSRASRSPPSRSCSPSRSARSAARTIRSRSARLEEDRLGGRARHRRRSARPYVPANSALDYVAGYCVANDVSEREFQLERGGTWYKGKSWRPSPVRPVAGDQGRGARPGQSEAMARGRRPSLPERLDRQDDLQRAAADQLHEPHVRAAAGRRDRDRHAAGVGAGIKPEPIFLKPGNVMRLGIDGLGEQRQEVVAAE